ncbi:large ribosomal subunit protein mL44 [Anabrus simplex]|uniref:large ribosomal subunit protein mL44 n=1 Tax=Anabrus simplex TaxID=316456 RepID=UPI0035A3797A
MATLRKCIGAASLLTANCVKYSHLITAQRSFKRWVAPTLRELKRRRDKLGPEPPSKRSSFLEWNYKAEQYAFGKRLNEEFREDLLLQAFTHRSYIIQEEEKQKEVGIEDPQLDLQDNRELVETGDQFIRQYISTYIRRSLPRFPEEGIRAVCDYLMSVELLAHISSGIGTKDLILSSDFPPEPLTLANTFKAVVAVLLESSGTKQAGRFVLDFVVTHLSGVDVNDIWHPEDCIKTLADILSREGRSEAEPRLLGEVGRNTVLAAYHVGMYVDKELIGKGVGETIDIAKEMAALDALKKMFCTTDSMSPFLFHLDVDVDGKSVDPVQNVSIENWSQRNIVQC